MREVKREISGFRDESLSRRHRTWGWDCPAVDIDLLMIEYDMGEPIALVEYKNSRRPNGTQTPEPDWSKTNYKAIKLLADKYPVPCMAVFYNPTTWCFRVFPGNEEAKVHFPNSSIIYHEYEYVRTLYQMRDKEIPDDIASSLSRHNPHLRIVEKMS